MNFTTAIQTCFRKYITFSGRAPRSEYWWFFLFHTLVERFATVLERSMPQTVVAEYELVSIAVILVLFLPFTAVTVRRLHDVGRSGWWLGATFLSLLALGIGFVVAPNAAWVDLALAVPAIALSLTLLVWTILKGKAFENRYGPDPLAPAPQPAPPSCPQEIPQWTGPETRS